MVGITVVCLDTIRGIVVFLSRSRCLAGWSMGEGMASVVYPEIFDSARDAAMVADEHARAEAEQQDALSNILTSEGLQ